MHDLKMPLALPCRRVETDQGFTKQVGPGPPASEKIVARRTDRHVKQTALLIERHRRPYVGVPHELPGILTPRIVAEFAGLGDGVEAPYLFARVGIKSADIAWRIVPVNQAISDAVTDDHQVLIDHGRR